MSERFLNHPKHDFERHRGFEAWTWWTGLGFSLVIHGFLFWSLATLSARMVSRPVSVNVRLESSKYLAEIPKVDPAKINQVEAPRQRQQPEPRPSKKNTEIETQEKAEVKAGVSRESTHTSEKPVAAPLGNSSETLLNTNDQNTAVGASSPENLGDDNMPISEAAADADASCRSPAELAITNEAAMAGITSGAIIIDIVVSKAGKVIEAKLVKGIGYGLDELALRAVKDLSCTPAFRDGSAVAVKKRFVWKVEF